MPNPQIVETATRRPGADLLTGESEGPFLDTAVDIENGRGRRGDRIYLSLKHLAPVLEEYGWLRIEVAEELKAEVAELRERNAKLEETEDAYHHLLDLVRPYVAPEVKERVVTREVPREPTYEEMAVFVRKNAAQLLRDATRTKEEQYRATYQGHGYVSGDKPRKPAKLETGEREEETVEETTSVKYDPVTYELEGQEVVLDELLKRPAKTVLAFVKGHEEEFVEAVVEREYELGELKGKPHPRKNVIEGLGYVYEEEDEA